MDKFDFNAVDRAVLKQTIEHKIDTKTELLSSLDNRLDELTSVIKLLRESGEIDSIERFVAACKRLPTYIELMDSAAQIKVYQKCRDDYNAMCRAVQGEFINNVRVSLKSISKDLKQSISESLKRSSDSFQSQLDNQVDKACERIERTKNGVTMPTWLFCLLLFIGLIIATLIGVILFQNVTTWHFTPIDQLLNSIAKAFGWIVGIVFVIGAICALYVSSSNHN